MNVCKNYLHEKSENAAFPLYREKKSKNLVSHPVALTELNEITILFPQQFLELEIDTCIIKF